MSVADQQRFEGQERELTVIVSTAVPISSRAGVLNVWSRSRMRGLRNIVTSTAMVYVVATAYSATVVIREAIEEVRPKPLRLRQLERQSQRVCCTYTYYVGRRSGTHVVT